MGMRSIAVDVGPEKEELCKKLGAEVYIDALKCEDLTAEVTKITTYGGDKLPVLPKFGVRTDECEKLMAPLCSPPTSRAMTLLLICCALVEPWWL